MCDKKVPKGWSHISPPLTPEELLARKKARDEENQNTRTCILEDDEKHEYMGLIKDVVR